MLLSYIFYPLSFIAINIIIAKYHSYLRQKDLQNHTSGSIKHGWWAALYIGLVICAFFLDKKDYFLTASLITLRKPSFDISFNYFAKLPLFLASTTTTSIVDKINNFLFHNNAKLYQAFYAFITLLILFHYQVGQFLTNVFQLIRSIL